MQVFGVSIRRGPPGWSFLPVLTLEQGGIVFVHFDQLDEVLDAEVGERHDALIARAVDPDQAILLIHFGGDVPQPVSSVLRFSLIVGFENSLVGVPANHSAGARPG